MPITTGSIKEGYLAGRIELVDGTTAIEFSGIDFLEYLNIELYERTPTDGED